MADQISKAINQHWRNKSTEKCEEVPINGAVSNPKREWLCEHDPAFLRDIDAAHGRTSHHCL
jgi:hypothetical protein